MTGLSAVTQRQNLSGVEAVAGWPVVVVRDAEGVLRALDFTG